MRHHAKKPAATRGKINQAARPFLDGLAAMIAARLLAEHRARQRVLKGGAP